MAVAASVLVVVSSSRESAAQTPVPVLVSNQGQTAATAAASSATKLRLAGVFFTGDDVDGYLLSSVEIGLAAATGVSVEVYLRYGGYFHTDTGA